MSEQQTILVHNIEINTTHPTSQSFDELNDWVIWQFTQKTEDGLSGAVRPPLPNANWYPALIQPKEKRVQIYGHLNTLYSTPEKAAAQTLTKL